MYLWGGKEGKGGEGVSRVLSKWDEHDKETSWVWPTGRPFLIQGWVDVDAPVMRGSAGNVTRTDYEGGCKYLIYLYVPSSRL